MAIFLIIIEGEFTFNMLDLCLDLDLASDVFHYNDAWSLGGERRGRLTLVVITKKLNRVIR